MTYLGSDLYRQIEALHRSIPHNQLNEACEVLSDLFELYTVQEYEVMVTEFEGTIAALSRKLAYYVEKYPKDEPPKAK